MMGLRDVAAAVRAPGTKKYNLRLTPQGRLALLAEDDAPELEAQRAARIERAFARGAGHGLLLLGAAEVGSVLPPVFAYWRELGARYVTAVCTRPTDDRSG